ncbi:UvrD-helicase domain-containing protein [Litchfieldia alkalitelluris]|uniref:UvrD-helicase domain-containing protein n=1 Tax=Litchfieldia alkalitelluris TaxID=304268 RepID=UPI00099672FF|nr:UvrD-helicase domain-containing protein [Litchfieldia alkalitelluris]
MNFNTEQKQAIFGTEKLIVISAGAGSGKTKVLTERYIYLCEQKLKGENIGASVDEIVALTFTEDAALEMRDRIRHNLENKRLQAEDHDSKNFWLKQMELLEGAIISTFHSFCQRILSEHSFEAELFPDMKVLDESGSFLLKHEVLSQMIEQAVDEQKWPHVFKAMEEYQIKDAVVSLYEKMREFEFNDHKKIHLLTSDKVKQWILKRNGSIEELYGKIVNFYAEDHDSSKFTKTTTEPYSDLKEVVDCYPEYQIGFFEDVYKALIKIKKAPHATIKKQCQPFYELLEQWVEVRDFCSCASRENLIFIESFSFEFGQLLEEFSLEYEFKKREQALLDFSDLQQKSVSLLTNKDLSTFYQEKYKHFMIDEFQDTNQLQLSMLDKIRPEYTFIVGDGKQSIYRFRGADVRLINQKIKESKEKSNARFIDMNINYRTCGSIIEFINQLFEQNHMMGYKLNESTPIYKTEYTPLIPNRNSVTELDKRVEYIKVSEQHDETEDRNQYMMIARRAVELWKNKTLIFDKDSREWRPVLWSDIAVLIPSRASLSRLERAFNKYQVPYSVHSGVGFYDRNEIVEMTSLLNWINRPFEPLHIIAMLRGPLIGLTVEDLLDIHALVKDPYQLGNFLYEEGFLDETTLNSKVKMGLQKFVKMCKRFVPFMLTGSVEEKLKQIFEESGLKYLFLMNKNGLHQVRNVEKLIDQLVDMNTPSLEEMLTKLSILKSASKDREGDADVERVGGETLSIMTIHGSKGLEFPVVFVPNLSKSLQTDKSSVRFDPEEGMYLRLKWEDKEEFFSEEIQIETPDFSSLSSDVKNQELEESKRLLYVALTRARDYLILTTKEKDTSNTWANWLNEGLMNNQQLLEMITIKDEIEEQDPVGQEFEIYSGPTKKVERRIPIYLSVSEILTYLQDPTEHYYRYILKIEPMEEELPQEETKWWAKRANGIDPLLLGTLVHKVCELLDQGLQRNEAYDNALLLVDRDKENYLTQLDPLIDSYISKNLGTSIENEWGFELEMEHIIIIGEIDKVVDIDGDLYVIDLKTNRINDNLEDLISYYKPQLYLYKLAYEQKTGKQINGMKLFLLRDEEQGLYDIEVNPEFKVQLMQKIEKLANEIQTFKSNQHC